MLYTNTSGKMFKFAIGKFNLKFSKFYKRILLINANVKYIFKVEFATNLTIWFKLR